ncbi:hypothetical protein HN51_021141 [Arachis hypogaea]
MINHVHVHTAADAKRRAAARYPARRFSSSASLAAPGRSFLPEHCMHRGGGCRGAAAPAAPGPSCLVEAVAAAACFTGDGRGSSDKFSGGAVATLDGDDSERHGMGIGRGSSTTKQCGVDGRVRGRRAAPGPSCPVEAVAAAACFTGDGRGSSDKFSGGAVAMLDGEDSDRHGMGIGRESSTTKQCGVDGRVRGRRGVGGLGERY